MALYNFIDYPSNMKLVGFCMHHKNDDLAGEMIIKDKLPIYDSSIIYLLNVFLTCFYKSSIQNHDQ